MGYDHTLTTQASLKPGTTTEQVEHAFRPLLDYFGYEGFAEEKNGDHELEFNPVSGELHIYTNGEVGHSFGDLVEAVAENLGPLTKMPGYFVLSDYDTGDIDNARNKIYFGASAEEIEAFKAKEDITEAMSLLAGRLDSEAMAKLQEIVNHAQGKPENHLLPAASPEILPGATKEEIVSIMMQDLVGDYCAPDQVPEWSWVERVASYAHAKNGQDGIWEFVLNLSFGWDDIPDRLLPVISKARANNIAYLIVHQGT